MRTYFLLFIAGTVLLFSSCHKGEIDQASIRVFDASEITAHTAILSGSVRGVSESAIVGVQYCRESGFSKELTKTVGFDGKPSQFSVPVKMLAPNREYYYRVFAEDKGERIYSDVSSFITLDSPIPEGAVDMGLSVYWAAKNLGAESLFTPGLIEKFGDWGNVGDLYAWGETEPKEDYSWETYKFAVPGLEKTRERPDGYGVSKYNIWEGNGPVDWKTVLEREDDAAVVKLGNGWRMPTIEEYRELLDEANSFVVGDTQAPNQSWIIGYVVISRVTGKKLFFPRGYQFGTQYFDHGAFYQSSSLNVTSDISYDSYKMYVSSCGIFFANGRYEFANLDRADGYPIRPVHE